MLKLWREWRAFLRWRRRTVRQVWMVMPGTTLQYGELWVSRDAIQVSNPDPRRVMRIEVYYPAP